MQQVVNKTHKEDIYRSYANLIGKSGTAELKMKQGETGRQIGWFTDGMQQVVNKTHKDIYRSYANLSKSVLQNSK